MHLKIIFKGVCKKMRLKEFHGNKCSSMLYLTREIFNIINSNNNNNNNSNNSKDSLKCSKEILNSNNNKDILLSITMDSSSNKCRLLKITINNHTRILKFRLNS